MPGDFLHCYEMFSPKAAQAFEVSTLSPLYFKQSPLLFLPVSSLQALLHPTFCLFTSSAAAVLLVAILVRFNTMILGNLRP